MEKPSTALFLENQLCFPLYAASRLTTKVYQPFLEELALTYPQYLVMLCLWQHGEQSVKKIGERLYLASNTLTPLLKRLADKELISRNRSQEDERTVLASLTKAGEALKEQAMGIPEAIINSFHDERISEDEIRAFQKTLFTLMDVLDKKLTE